MDNPQPSTNNTGKIYKISFPGYTDKIYIGQTIKTLDLRLYQHTQDAMNEYNRCPALDAAIRKYTVKNTVIELVMECNVNELDANEITYIKYFNSTVPNGYNIAKGGGGNSSQHTDDYKRDKSKQMRKNGIDEDLPMYIRKKINKGSPGYTVQKPGFRTYHFNSPELSMVEKLNLAKECLNKIDNNDDIIDDGYKQYDFTKTLPKYISYLGRCDGFRVTKPGFPNRYFKSTKITRDEKLQKAIEYLNSCH